MAKLGSLPLGSLHSENMSYPNSGERLGASRVCSFDCWELLHNLLRLTFCPFAARGRKIPAFRRPAAASPAPGLQEPLELLGGHLRLPQDAF